MIYSNSAYYNLDLTKLEQKHCYQKRFLASKYPPKCVCAPQTL